MITCLHQITTFAYSGVEGNIITEVGTSAGGTTIPGGDVDVKQKWDIKYEVNTFDKTTTADAGWDSTGCATKKVSGSFTFFYNPAKDPATVLGVDTGQFPDVKMYINKTDNIFFSGQALITGLSYSVAVIKRACQWSASFVKQRAVDSAKPSCTLGSRRQTRDEYPRTTRR